MAKSLREKLIEKYMEVGRSFYFEGSDEETERQEYAPDFANSIIALIKEKVVGENEDGGTDPNARYRSEPTQEWYRNQLRQSQRATLDEADNG